MVASNLAVLKERIEKAAKRSGRHPREITLVCVTKSADFKQLNEAISAGITDIGENRVQDAVLKYNYLGGMAKGRRWHMIGHLQTNKVRAAVRLCDVIQSVDSVKTARAIDTHSAACGQVMEVLVQVNASDEPQKSGVRPDEALGLLEEISGLQHLRAMGLMTIGLLSGDPAEIGPCFQRTREVFGRARTLFDGHPRVRMVYLSMGMSGDYEIALQHGANMLRIGSAFFS